MTHRNILPNLSWVKLKGLFRFSYVFISHHSISVNNFICLQIVCYSGISARNVSTNDCISAGISAVNSIYSSETG